MTSATNQLCSFCNRRPALPCLERAKQLGASPFYCVACHPKLCKIEHPNAPSEGTP